MKKVLMSMTFLFCVTFVFSQAGPLSVTNFTNQNMTIWAGAASGCNAGNAVVTATQTIAPGATATFAAPLSPSDVWIGFKAVSGLGGSTLGSAWGKFHNPCTACGPDQSFNLNVFWQGCFNAAIF